MDRYVTKNVENNFQSFIKEATELFNICHEGKNGFITMRDLWKHHDKFLLTPDQLEVVFSHLDKDKNGYINEEEFIEGYALYLGIDLEELKKQELLEKKIIQEKKEEENFESLLNTIGKGEESDINQIWNQIQEKNPEMNSEEFKRVVVHFGKEFKKNKNIKDD
ncbi:EF-hand calcium-binding domain-containing protein 4A-like [Centruroides sculpturatus]|uniref:EF-hand calcium-binding domain-containing protein 4A-like n=1 Tax=Centruroides sculpturatus TaxID=218467 RepID=UPI000C6D03F8|nr:EF-hand calcium-binding domain-containing protein 4A-like [Centruroides sculpturatus]